MQVGKPGAEQTESPSPGPVLGLAVGVTWVSAAVGSPSALLIPWGHVPGPSKGDWDQGLLNSGHPGGGGLTIPTPWLASPAPETRHPGLCPPRPMFTSGRGPSEWGGVTLCRAMTRWAHATLLPPLL